MKRLLLSLVCCSPLLFSPSVSLSVDLTGPSGDTFLAFEQYGPVSPTETLWAISSKLRPDNSVSVQQTMVAIYKTNPFAFYKGDINKIIPESIIKVPSLEFVAEQSDREAMALIKKYSSKKSVAKKAPVKAQPVVETQALTQLPPEAEVVKVDPAIAAENEFNKQKASTAEQRLATLQAEMLLLNEQFIVATEATQVLKLKLQPLSDEISFLSEQLAEEAAIQVKLQKIIDDYRAQLDAVELPPYSGEGMLNEILRLITSSLTNLLVVILSPVLLLLFIFVLISRIRAKRQLAEHEQELAESTSILMEESGQFDELLTDDFSEDENAELDFTADEEMAAPESVDIDELDDLVLPDSDEDITADDASLTSQDDPFGIGSLADDEELISSVDIDEDELVTSEDDPFGIGALVDDEELISSVDLDEGEDDPFGIGALSEDDDLMTSVDLDDDEPISAAEQADLDLAAEWEAQVLAETETNSVKEIDVVAESESDLDLAMASPDVDSSDIDALLEGAPVENLEVDSSDIDALLDGAPVENLDVDSSDIDALLDAAPVENLDVDSSNIDALLDAEPVEDLEVDSSDIDALLDGAPVENLDVDSSDIDALLDGEPVEDLDALLDAAPVDSLDVEDLDLDVDSSDIDTLLDAEPVENLDVDSSDIDALLDAEPVENLDVEDLDIDALLETAPEEVESVELDIEDVAALDETPDLDLSALEEDETADLDLSALEEDETADLDLSALEEDETADLDLSALEEDETADLDLSALEEDEIPELDLSALEEDETPELDLSALEEDETAELDLSSPEEDETPELDLSALEEDETAELDLSSLEEEETPELDLSSLEEDETPELDLSALEEDETPELDLSALVEDETPELDLSVLEEDETPELDLSSLEEDETPELDLSSLEEDETPELDLSALEEDETPELDLSEFEESTDEVAETNDVDKEHDLLAQQLSNVAFNEAVPLPKVERGTGDNFIDIETLLENSDDNTKDEPYSELALDLGLEEFPDVVDLQESVDIDDDENGIGAQLDLARAYLEIDDQAGAKEILMSVVGDSNGKQRIEIDKLLSRLK
ncbi:FimV/HubP family polar landmark protein [Psychromonas sp. Urea-02u-13]|uniref:FimV/HubP family polar landmark protein n=1 Tax=Psychromonas sp. Urea-02u-13 TaxID=2058326 RepID=UPI0018E2A18C|nr:FimV/HubP family polar landmark protein [Psychromonas sp. Urea-02u-13]